jgi:hypothetical protein
MLFSAQSCKYHILFKKYRSLILFRVYCNFISSFSDIHGICTEYHIKEPKDKKTLESQSNSKSYMHGGSTPSAHTSTMKKWVGKPRCFGAQRAAAQSQITLACVRSKSMRGGADPSHQLSRQCHLWLPEPRGVVAPLLADGHGRTLLAMAG